jgi:hypothetical protein
VRKSEMPMADVQDCNQIGGQLDVSSERRHILMNSNTTTTWVDQTPTKETQKDSDSALDNSSTSISIIPPQTRI